jgi:hypothetical protein
MKFMLAAMILLSAVCHAEADGRVTPKYRLADSSDVCVAGCSNQNASCKRVCPTTFSTPCLNSCDSQMQTCQRGCQAK